MGMRNLDDVGVVDPSDVLCDPWQTRVSCDKIFEACEPGTPLNDLLSIQNIEYKPHFNGCPR
jgi:hypothetical protein